MPHTTRQSILETALEVLMKDGVGALTLDRVARDAGLSKGGLLYHYEGKEQLLEGLVELLIRDWDHEQTQELVTQTANNGQHPSYSSTNREPDGAEHVQTTNRSPLHGREIASILMAARAINPQLLKPIQKRYGNWQHMVRTNGTTSIRPLMARLATMGLWFSEALGTRNTNS